MTDKGKLKCPHCGGNLELHVVYDGCDWDSVKGEGSGFKYEIVLECVECPHIYAIGRLKDEFAFCENIEKLRPYGKGPAEPDGGAEDKL